jgi:hypothetical protein
MESSKLELGPRSLEFGNVDEEPAAVPGVTELV